MTAYKKTDIKINYNIFSRKSKECVSAMSGFHIWKFPSKKGCRARSIPFVYLQINRRRCPA